MFFKNAHFFKLPHDFELDVEQLSDQLSQYAFAPCLPKMLESIGWKGAFGDGTELFYATQGNILLTLAVQDKILPASVIKEQTDERIADIEKKESRNLRKKERDAIKDDVQALLIPQAFTKTTITRGYIDTQHHLLVIDSSSSKVIDRFTEFLRKTLGSLPIEPPKTDDPALIMTQWLKSHDYPESFVLHDQCTLESEQGKNTATIKCNGHDLLSDNIKAFISEGGIVTEVSMGWKDQVDFVLTEGLTIKGIKFLDVIKTANMDINAETKEEQLVADFIIMAEALSELIDELLIILGFEENKASQHVEPINETAIEKQEVISFEETA